MDKTTKENIKKLKKEKIYDEIFRQYGRKIYLKNTPFKYQLEDINYLEEDGGYEDIFNKYEESAYNSRLINAKYKEIKEAKGNFKALMWEITQSAKSFLTRLGIGSAVLGTTAMLTLTESVQSIIDKNAVTYKEDIENYDENINKYAEEVKEEIKKENLTDLDVIMKVTDDMWKNIKGYDNPEKNVIGFAELDLASQDGVGVCRNMASDVAKKLNKIDEKYNARTMIVNLESGNYEIADIQRTIIEENETAIANNDEENEKNTQETESLLNLFVGNHMITLVDIAEKNITLVIDPTNPGLGVYHNGQIYMFNSTNENRARLDSKELTTMVYNGFNGVDTAKTYLDSFTNFTISYDELNKEFGVDAQNKALEKVRNLENSKENTFKDSLKVSIQDNKVEDLKNTKTNQKTINNENER